MTKRETAKMVLAAIRERLPRRVDVVTQFERNTWKASPNAEADHVLFHALHRKELAAIFSKTEMDDIRAAWLEGR